MSEIPEDQDQAASKKNLEETFSAFLEAAIDFLKYPIKDVEEGDKELRDRLVKQRLRELEGLLLGIHVWTDEAFGTSPDIQFQKLLRILDIKEE